MCVLSVWGQCRQLSHGGPGQHLQTANSQPQEACGFDHLTDLTIMSLDKSVKLQSKFSKRIVQWQTLIVEILGSVCSLRSESAWP